MPIVIIAGTMQFPADKRAAALHAGKPEIEGALTQPGCESYAWTPDPFDEETVHVYEKWSDIESLQAHLSGRWYAGMRTVLGAHGVRAADVRKYRVDLDEPVYDSSGNARGDFFTA